MICIFETESFVGFFAQIKIVPELLLVKFFNLSESSFMLMWLKG